MFSKSGFSSPIQPPESQALFNTKGSYTTPVFPIIRSPFPLSLNSTYKFDVWTLEALERRGRERKSLAMLPSPNLILPLSSPCPHWGWGTSLAFPDYSEVLERGSKDHLEQGEILSASFTAFFVLQFLQHRFFIQVSSVVKQPQKNELKPNCGEPP